MQYQRIQAKSALNKLNSRYLPYDYDLNVYRGCSHHCQYCYALYSHRYLEKQEFFNQIYIKENILEALERDLSKKSWHRQAINLGGVTDSYQSIEATEKLMPGILKLLIKYQNPVIISTKSDLILRDFDLFLELAKVADVRLACSITTFDETIRRKIEPCSPTALARLEVLKKFKAANLERLKVGVLMMPILPLLTDSEENLKDIFSKVSSIDIDYILPGLLNLRGQTREHFLNFIKVTFPEKYAAYLDIYQTAFVKKEYRENFYQKINQLRREYQLPQVELEISEEEQLGLF